MLAIQCRYRPQLSHYNIDSTAVPEPINPDVANLI